MLNFLRSMREQFRRLGRRRPRRPNYLGGPGSNADYEPPPNPSRSEGTTFPPCVSKMWARPLVVQGEVLIQFGPLIEPGQPGRSMILYPAGAYELSDLLYRAGRDADVIAAQPKPKVV